jgi:tRNA pseudouridine55 synthase
MNGALVIDKAAGMTSHDVVARVRRITGERSVGHLGTLDPMANGVLPLLLGRHTRLAQFFTHSLKVYEGVIRFGFATDTYDAEGAPVSERRQVVLHQAEVKAALAAFRGEIEQLPPPFSAKKIQGVPAYRLARKKQEVALGPVRVTVHEFELLALDADLLRFRAQVSAGTYLRSLAHDLGRALGVGAHLLELRRTASGEFTLKNAVSLEELEAAPHSGSIETILISARQMLRELPSVTATEEQLVRIRYGNAVNLPEFSAAKYVKVFAAGEELAAIVTRVAGTLFQPKVVLAESTEMSNVR